MYYSVKSNIISQVQYIVGIIGRFIVADCFGREATSIIFFNVVVIGGLVN